MNKNSFPPQKRLKISLEKVQKIVPSSPKFEEPFRNNKMLIPKVLSRHLKLQTYDKKETDGDGIDKIVGYKMNIP